MRSSARERLNGSSSPRLSEVSNVPGYPKFDSSFEKGKIMASFVADEVLNSDYHYNDYKELNGCILYARISGFNELVSSSLTKGTEEVDLILGIVNEFYSHTLQEILASGGDVIKFSSKFLIALWKSEIQATLGFHVHQAIDCAIVIQKYCRNYANSENLDVSVRSAISVGSILISYLGDSSFTHFLVFGQLLEELTRVRKNNKEDDIITSITSLQYINASEYLHEPLPKESSYVKVREQWEQGVGFFIKLCGSFCRVYLLQILGLSQQWRRLPKYQLEDDQVSYVGSSADSSVITVLAKIDSGSYCLRPSTNHVFLLQESALRKLRRFLLLPVVRSIESGEPLQNLTEIRTIVVASAKIATREHRIWDILNIAHVAMQIFQRNASANQGTVYSFTICDKVIYICLVYGLRGHKHVLNSKRCLMSSLTSSMEIKTTISSLDAISVGICGGKTFCSVIGHSLRRDYLIIGDTAIRAKMLAISCVNQVICDEHVFLHSKLTYDCFNVRKNLNNKGTNQTVTYEFLHHDRLVKNANLKYAKPILGRQDEMNFIRNWLKIWLLSEGEDRKNNILLIKGYAKQGKTRLLREIEIESTTPVNIFHLYSGTEKMPYYVISELFAAPLKWKETTPVEKKRRVLEQMLPNIPEVLFAIYEVFHLVSYVPSSYQLSAQNKQRTIEECLKILCRLCFKSPWLIAIDNIDYMDDQSWMALQPLIETNSFVLIMTFNKASKIPLTKVHNEHIAKIIELDGIENKYLTTFACQFLNVYAIPVELEFVLHNKSNCNPGWIENLLVTLLESEQLIIKEECYVNLSYNGLVAPPKYPVRRLLLGNTEVNREFRENAYSSNGTENSQFDLWSSFADIGTDMEEIQMNRRSISETLLLNQRNCSVCVSGVNFDINLIKEEGTIEFLYGQIYDELSHEQQLFLKCCSVLGYTFPRSVLKYILPSAIGLSLAKHVQAMFEKLILCCAGGDFTERPVLMRDKIKDPSKTDNIICECRNLLIEDSHTDFPKYAFCGFLRFRSTILKDKVYKALNKDDRKDFHSKAIAFIQDSTRRCMSCGGDKFKMQVPAQRDLMISKSRRKKKKKSKRSHFIDYYENVQLNSIIGGYNILPSTSSHRDFLSRNFSTTASLDVSRRSSNYDHLDYDEEPEVMPRIIGQMKRLTEITNTFSYIDFTFCECDDILIEYHYQMLIHYGGTEQFELRFHHIVEYCYIFLRQEKASVLKSLLEEAKICIEQIFNTPKSTSWKKRLYEGKVMTIQAQVLMQEGKYEESTSLLLAALKKYNKSLPSGSMLKFLKSKRQKLFIYYSAFLSSSKRRKDLTLTQYYYYCDVAETLGLLCEIFKLKEDWICAELTGLWSLIKALKARVNFSRICQGYRRLLILYPYMKQRKISILLEVMALSYCSRKSENMELEEFREISKLYGVITYFRMMRGDIDSSIQIGFITVRMYLTQHCNFWILEQMAYLVTFMISKCYFQESAYILSEIGYYSNDIDNIDGKIWYHAQAMLFHHKLGYTIIPYQKCREFCVNHWIWQTERKNKDGSLRLLVLMWLWCIRNELWEEANLYTSEIQSLVNKVLHGSMCQNYSISFVVEGYLIYLVHLLDQMNISEAQKLCHTLDNLLTHMKEVTNLILSMKSRIYFYFAYYEHIKNNTKTCYRIIDQTLKICRKEINTYQEKFVEHHISAWNKKLPEKIVNFWRNHSSPDNLIFYEMVDKPDDFIGFFTFPTPKYITKNQVLKSTFRF